MLCQRYTNIKHRNFFSSILWAWLASIILAFSISCRCLDLCDKVWSPQIINICKRGPQYKIVIKVAIFNINTIRYTRNQCRCKDKTSHRKTTINSITYAVALSWNNTSRVSNSSVRDLIILMKFSINIHPPKAPIIKEECRAFLHNIVLQVDIMDHWQWQLDTVAGYTVRWAYQLLATTQPRDHSYISDLIWQKEFPLKMSIMVWCLIQSWIPFKDNLLRRGNITNDSRNCVIRCDVFDTSNHLFMECNFFSPICVSTRQWLQFDLVHPSCIVDHLICSVWLFGWWF